MTFIINDRRAAQRADNLRQLVAILQTRNLTRDEIGQIIGMKRSAVREYLADLAPVVNVVEKGAIVGQDLYGITADAAAIATYLEELKVGAPMRGREQPTRTFERAERAGRRFHIMQDDAEWRVRVSRAAPFRDVLVSALFGPAAAGACA